MQVYLQNINKWELENVMVTDSNILRSKFNIVVLDLKCNLYF
jgi:hypothetical protein